LHEEFMVLDNQFQMAGVTDGSIVFGEKKKDARSLVRDHVDELRPAVAELAQLESNVQLNWWDMRNRFQNVCNKQAGKEGKEKRRE